MEKRYLNMYSKCGAFRIRFFKGPHFSLRCSKKGIPASKAAKIPDPKYPTSRGLVPSFGETCRAPGITAKSSGRHVRFSCDAWRRTCLIGGRRQSQQPETVSLANPSYLLLTFFTLDCLTWSHGLDKIPRG